MKVNTGFTFTDDDRRALRALIGRGGRATRVECRIFMDRVIREAIEAAPTRRQTRRVKRGPDASHVEGCPRRTASMAECWCNADHTGLVDDTTHASSHRERIARLYGHEGRA